MQNFVIIEQKRGVGCYHQKICVITEESIKLFKELFVWDFYVRHFYYYFELENVISYLSWA